MLKFCLIQALLCTLSAAQSPPTMPETFEITGEVELHGAEATYFGNFVIARNQDKELGFEREEYENGDVEETVLRYDMNATYYVRGKQSAPHCLTEDRNFNGMPNFWGWLSFSTYEGITSVREIDYDTWGTNIGGVRYEFGRPQTNSSIIYFYRRKTTEVSVFYSIMKLSTMPDSNLFKIPSECQQKY